MPDKGNSWANVIVSFLLLIAQLIQTSLSPHLYGEKLSRVTRLPELPWASQLFLHFLTKLDEPFS